MFQEYYVKIALGICVLSAFLSIFSEEEGAPQAIIGLCVAFLAYFFFWADSKGMTLVFGGVPLLLGSVFVAFNPSGGKTESETFTCPNCKGKGMSMDGGYDQWPDMQACPRCGGTIESSKHVIGGYYTKPKHRPGSGQVKIVRKYDKEGKLLSETESPAR